MNKKGAVPNYTINQTFIITSSPKNSFSISYDGVFMISFYDFNVPKLVQAVSDAICQ